MQQQSKRTTTTTRNALMRHPQQQPTQQHSQQQRRLSWCVLRFALSLLGIAVVGYLAFYSRVQQNIRLSVVVVKSVNNNNNKNNNSKNNNNKTNNINNNSNSNNKKINKNINNKKNSNNNTKNNSNSTKPKQSEKHDAEKGEVKGIAPKGDNKVITTTIDSPMPSDDSTNTKVEYSSDTFDFYFSSNISKPFKINYTTWRPRPKEDFSFPFPVFVASLPKSGTTSIFSFFRCGGIRSAHHLCAMAEEPIYLGTAIENNIRRKLPPFTGCEHNSDLGPVNVFTDAGYSNGTTKFCFYPSVTALDALYESYPNMTLMLGTRNSSNWYKSAKKWARGDLIKRWNIACPYMPDDDDEQKFIQFYEWHNAHVRDFAKRHPSITYIEFAVDSPTAGMYLGRTTNISTSCWTQENAVPDRPAVNNVAKPPTLPQQQQQQQQLGPEKDKMIETKELTSSTTTINSSRPKDIHNNSSNSNIAKYSLNTKDFYFSNNTNTSKIFKTDFRKWRPRPKTDFPFPFPVFVASLPKSGTTSIHSFFKCGGIRSAHYICNRGGKRHFLGVEIEKNVRLGHAPFHGCEDNNNERFGPVNAFSDTGYANDSTKFCFYPSYTALDALYKSYPKMTIVLGTRNSSKWYGSTKSFLLGGLIRRWTRACPFMPDQDDEKQFVDFYERHSDRVRDFAKRHPSITFIEFAVDSPTAGIDLGRQTNISATCWGHVRPRDNVKENFQRRYQGTTPATN